MIPNVMLLVPKITLPETNIAPGKWRVGRRSFPFRARPIFRGENLFVVAGYVRWDSAGPSSREVHSWQFFPSKNAPSMKFTKPNLRMDIF